MRKSRPNQMHSHCKGAGEKLTAHPHFSSESPTEGSSRGLPARHGGALLLQVVLSMFEGIFLLGRESPFLPYPLPSAVSEHTWPSYTLRVASALDFCPPTTPHPYFTWLVCVLSLGHFFQWQLYRQWRQWAQTEQQPGDSPMVRAWGKGHLAIRDPGRRQYM